MFQLKETIAADHAANLRTIIRCLFHKSEASVVILQSSTQSTASLNLITAFSDTSPSTPFARSKTLGFGCFVSYE